MYAGTTFTNYSGAIVGAHQKFDRVAYKNLLRIVEDMSKFPSQRDIIHFEGKNGPDGIKRKSPAKDELWHFYDPFDEDDSQLLDIIDSHYVELVRQLKKGSPERAAFDTAWLAHAIVDGLTPAHHYPYEKKLTELRGGGLHERNSIKNKIMIKGDTRRDSFKKNWSLWGSEGLISMHVMFEVGVALILSPLHLKTSRPSNGDIEAVISFGYQEYFKRAAREIALLDMYERFLKNGWSPRLIRDIRNELGPTIIKTVTLVWYSAMRDAGLLVTKK